MRFKPKRKKDKRAFKRDSVRTDTKNLIMSPRGGNRL